MVEGGYCYAHGQNTTPTNLHLAHQQREVDDDAAGDANHRFNLMNSLRLNAPFEAALTPARSGT